MSRAGLIFAQIGGSLFRGYRFFEKRNVYLFPIALSLVYLLRRAHAIWDGALKTKDNILGVVSKTHGIVECTSRLASNNQFLQYQINLLEQKQEQ